ncbi:MAG: 50S ribosomal protein L15 [Desulfurivibrionaceae bacterium]|nr:50S ribosomal protein L15 [Desulfurivibrionaceae bacterium]
MTLSNLSPNPGSRKARKRVGRGQGSGHGKTATRGHKGYKARSGSSIKPGFEGGQMPLQRRIPKRGFNNIFRKEHGVVNVGDLDVFEAGTRIDRAVLVDAGLVAKKFDSVKILGNGEIGKPLTFAVDKLSETARKKIAAAGGTIEG